MRSKSNTYYCGKNIQLSMVDAVIAATAIALNLPFITADKQFRTVKELQLLHYDR
ncbi:MAG: type II toxin-antitoxin system VapC family toxin [Sphingobacteriales bacterium]|jgi:predicted nucleic acid-binding protein